MNTIPQITRALPKIRIPAWRRASPKKWNTRPLKMSPKAWPQKRMMSPSEATQSRGTASQPIRKDSRPPSAVRRRPTADGRPCSGGPSSDHQDLGMGGEQRLGEHVVEGPDPREGD